MREDLDLVALLLAGDEAVIGEVRGWIGSGLARYRRRLRDDDEDLEQEVLLEIMESLAAGRFRSESRFETYVRSFVRFKCVDRLRSLGRRDFVQLDDDLVVLDSPSPLDEVVQRETAALTQRVLEALPASCRELWGMIADGMSYRDMSQVTGLSEGTIRVRVHRCRQRAWKSRDRLLAEGLR